MATEFEIVNNRFKALERQIKTHDTDHLSVKATICMSLIERWGLVAAKPDGEDSSGRTRYDLQTVDELVTRAVETVDAAFNAFKERGWLIQLPTIDEMKAMTELDEL